MNDPAPESSTPPDIRGTRSGKRYFAAVVDNAAAIIIALACAALLPIRHDMTRGLSAYAFYLLYYGAAEGLCATTPGKWYFGLRVVDGAGRPCRMWQAALRSLGRILDANPLFLGALPAALLVFFTSRRQHLGDFFAGTYVVDLEDLPR